MSESYWKIYLLKDDTYGVVNLHHYDEVDYDQSRFLMDEKGAMYTFYTEDSLNTGEHQAKVFLNKVIKPEFICEEDRIANNPYRYQLPIEEWETE